MGLYNLAKHLGPDQPFYGIQSLGWDGEVVPFTKSTEMAAHHVAEMRKIQPHGPYYLGGYYSGGRIAVYMANILKELGEEVALLAILGSYSLAGRKYVRIGQWLDRIGAPSGPGRIGLVRRYVRSRIHLAYGELYDRALRSVLFPVYVFYRATGKSLPPLLSRPDACSRLMRNEHRHMPTYEGDAVYFRVEINDHSMSHVDLHDSWNRIIKGRLDTIPLTATADQIVNEPHVKLLAEKLALELARARKK